MNKTILKLLILITILTMIPNHLVYASNNDQVENLIEIKSVSYKDRQYTINQNIQVEVGSKYTFVFDKAIFGENLKYLRSDNFGITIYYNFFYSDKIEITEHDLGHYSEFFPSRNIEKIFIKTANYEISTYPLFMLYQGDFESFSGFLDNDKQKTESLVYLTKSAEPASIEDIIETLEIEANFDDYDLLIYNDEYTPNQLEKGLYDVEIHLVDLAKNLLKKYNFKVKVLDYTIPYIEGPDEVLLYRRKNTSLEDVFLQENYYINDNGVHIEGLYIESKTWNVKYAGTYEARIFGWDESGNEVEKIISIELIDNTPPTIKKNADIIFTFIENNPLTKNDLLSSFEISDDDLFQNLTIEFEGFNLYIENSYIEGDYEIILKVSDLSNNESSENIIIRTIKQKNIVVKPNIRFFLTMDVSNKMTIKEIEDWFINQLAEVDVSATNIELLFTNYNVDSKKGSYYMDLLYDSKGEQIRERITINIESTKDKKMTIIFIASAVLCGGVVIGVGFYFIYYKKIKYKKLNS